MKINLNSFIRLFNNILSNSINFSNYGRPVDITYSQEENYHIFSVQDYGKGLTDIELNLLMNDSEKLYSKESETNGKGTGLGTKIIKSVVKNYHGTVIFKSDAN